MIKTYVLDTNVLMTTEGKALTGFDDNNVVVTHTTLEELDRLKTSPGERGYQAREAVRAIVDILEKKSENESVSTGITMENGGHFRVETNNLNDRVLPTGWDLTSPDNRIICTCLNLIAGNKVTGHEEMVILVTNDVSMSVKAQTVKLPVEDYHNDTVRNIDKLYTGRSKLELSDERIDLLYEDGYLYEDEDQGLFSNLHPNEFVIAESPSGKNALAYKDPHEPTLHVIRNDKTKIYGITPKNAAQRFALQALLAPADEIPLVILKGPAGTGKTLLSVAAGLEGTYAWKSEEKDYNSVVITRSNTLSDEDMGFLPGSLEDKMAPLLAPFMDNLKFLLGEKIEEKSEVQTQIDDMIETGVVEITSLSYIRGRSLNNTYLILDEAQNTTRLQMKTIVSRMGTGSKLVVLGDPDQIDNPKLDKKNNGLVYLAEKFKDSPLCAQVTFTERESVRSALAKEAIKLL